MTAKKRRRKRKTSVKAFLTKVRNIIAVTITIIACFFWLNDNYLFIDGIPSTYEILAHFGIGYKPYVKLEEGETSVSFIDVGQGDCTLIRSGSKSILIDCGESEYSSTVKGFLNYAGVRKLDMVIVTHPHSDHYGGMESIIRSFKTDLVLMPRVNEEEITDYLAYARFMETVKNRGAECRAPVVGETFELSDGAFLQVVSPVRSDYEDMNDCSITTRLVHGENSFLFTGDAGFEAEYDMIDSGADIDADVLKVGHHGSSGSTSEEFLHYVTPEIAVFMVAKENRYGHPKREVLERLARAGCDETYSTAHNGNLVFVSDGVSLEKYTERQEAIYIEKLFGFG